MAGTGTAHLRAPGDVLLRVEDLVVEFPAGRSGLKVHAVSGISLDVKEGETLGLVGESGCGKSTTGKAIMQLPAPKSGEVLFEGRDMAKLSGAELRRTRTSMKMIFQDPISSLNPRRKVEDVIAEGLRIWKVGTDDEQQKNVDDIMLAVGRDPRPGSERPPRVAGQGHRRDPVAGRAAFGLPVPYPVSEGSGEVRGRRAAGARSRRRSVRGVPLPARTGRDVAHDQRFRPRRG